MIFLIWIIYTSWLHVCTKLFQELKAEVPLFYICMFSGKRKLLVAKISLSLKSCYMATFHVADRTMYNFLLTKLYFKR